MDPASPRFDMRYNNLKGCQRRCISQGDCCRDSKDNSSDRIEAFYVSFNKPTQDIRLEETAFVFHGKLIGLLTEDQKTVVVPLMSDNLRAVVRRHSLGTRAQWTRCSFSTVSLGGQNGSRLFRVDLNIAEERGKVYWKRLVVSRAWNWRKIFIFSLFLSIFLLKLLTAH